MQGSIKIVNALFDLIIVTNFHSILLLPREGLDLAAGPSIKVFPVLAVKLRDSVALDLIRR